MEGQLALTMLYTYTFILYRIKLFFQNCLFYFCICRFHDPIGIMRKILFSQLINSIKNKILILTFIYLLQNIY